MALIDPIIAEFDRECATTRRVLERVPDDKWSFKPHEKSMTLQELAGHLAEIPMWVEATCTMDVFEMDPGSYKPLRPETTGALLASFDELVAQAREILQGETDDHLHESWTLKVAGNVIVQRPRIEVLRDFILNHSIHHRAQLVIYLRLNDVAVPMIYGPTADEGM